MPDPQIVERTVYERVKVPEALLMPCAVTAMPVPGDTWHDVWVTMESKDREQRVCNDRFRAIRNWQEDELAE